MTKALTVKPTLKEVIIRINAVVNDPAARRKILQIAGDKLKGILAVYPPPGIWNRPPGTLGNNQWYERGYGSRWLRRDGSMGGKNTSQKFDRSWSVQPEDEFSVSVSTGVTYAPLLVDPEQRVNWANAHGWISVDQTAKEFEPEFEKIVLDELDEQIRKI